MTDDAMIAADLAFVARMHRAIRRGRERPHVGIKTDDRPFAGRFVFASASISGCGSPALDCVMTGDGDDGKALFLK